MRAFFVLVLVLAACERPFVDEEEPLIRILEPDLEETFPHSVIELKVTATSFRAVGAVRVNAVAMHRDEGTNIWKLEYTLRRGLNSLIFEANDELGVVGIDTAYAVHLPYAFARNAPRLPEGRGGHTATFARHGDLYVMGGAEHAGGAARAEVFVLPFGASAFTETGLQLADARTGHTTTRLPDGRLLVLGGSRIDNAAAVSDLVETAEILDPESGRLFEVPVNGQPIRRTLHSATLRPGSSGRILVDLYGGRGDTRYGSDPFFGVRRDLRTFEVAGDRVLALNDLVSAPYLPVSVFGHTATQLQVGQNVIFGTYFDGNLIESAHFRLHYESDGSITVIDTAPMITPRNRHVAAHTLGHMVALFGGRQRSTSDVLRQTELYSDRADRFFRLPQQQVIRRFGHTGSTFGTRTVLLVGGFGLDGTSFLASEFFGPVSSEQRDTRYGDRSGTARNRDRDCDRARGDHC